MASVVVDWESVKRLVLAELERQSLRPVDLLQNLNGRYPDAVIKETVLRLLQDQSIEMTPDQQLQLTERAA